MVMSALPSITACLLPDIMLIEELLKELKEYRNELVSKNYPFQRISNLIVKYDDKVADELSRQKNIQGKIAR